MGAAYFNTTAPQECVLHKKGKKLYADCFQTQSRAVSCLETWLFLLSPGSFLSAGAVETQADCPSPILPSFQTLQDYIIPPRARWRLLRTPAPVRVLDV